MDRKLGLLFCLLALPAAAADIECNQGALHAAIAALNGTCSGDKTITFNCTNTTIYISDNANTTMTCNNGTPTATICTEDDGCPGLNCELNTDGCNGSGQGCLGRDNPYDCCQNAGIGNCCNGDKTQRIITCDGVTIDGETNNITLKLDPPCDGRVGPTACTELESQAYVFYLKGDNITIKNLTISHFWEGIWDEGADNVVENNVFNRGCDDVWTLSPSSTDQVRAVFRRNTVKLGCDKCLSLRGDDAQVYPYFDSYIQDNIFESCAAAISCGGGRHWIQGNQFLNLVPTGVFNAFGPHILDSCKAYFKGNLITLNRHGVRMGTTGGSTDAGQLISEGCNTWHDNQHRGIVATDSSIVYLTRDVLTDNGGETTGLNTAALCGVGFADASTGCLGGCSSFSIDGRSLTNPGLNRITGNRNGAAVACDFKNNVTGTSKIESNWWGSASSPTTVSSGTGSVDFDPWLTASPGPCRRVID